MEHAGEAQVVDVARPAAGLVEALRAADAATDDAHGRKRTTVRDSRGFSRAGGRRRSGVSLTGPISPESSGSQRAAVKRPSGPRFSSSRAGKFTL